MDREITALKAQKKNPNRISVYLDGEYAFGLARIVAAWLKIGQVLSEEDANRFQQQDAQEVGYQRALRLLGYRARSEAEIQRKLSEQGFDEAVIRPVLERLKEHGFLGDDKFAQEWVENRATFRPRSKRVLALELRQKGVTNEEIQKALAETEDESTLALLAAQQYARRLDGVDWETFRKRLGGHLARRGFSYGTIAPVLRQVWEETHSSASNKTMTQIEDDGSWTQ
jgi:regulatory protein